MVDKLIFETISQNKFFFRAKEDMAVAMATDDNTEI